MDRIISTAKKWVWMIPELEMEGETNIGDDTAFNKELTVVGSSGDIWNTDILYRIGNVVLYAKDLFQCIVEHISTLLLAPDKAKDKWVKYIDTTPSGEDWAVDIAYSIDDIAKFKTKVYRCLIAHVSTLALDPEKAKKYWVEVK